MIMVWNSETGPLILFINKATINQHCHPPWSGTVDGGKWHSPPQAFGTSPTCAWWPDGSTTVKTDRKTTAGAVGVAQACLMVWERCFFSFYLRNLKFWLTAERGGTWEVKTMSPKHTNTQKRPLLRMASLGKNMPVGLKNAMEVKSGLRTLKSFNFGLDNLLATLSFWDPKRNHENNNNWPTAKGSFVAILEGIWPQKHRVPPRNQKATSDVHGRDRHRSLTPVLVTKIYGAPSFHAPFER